ncbi:MAG TPA: YtxH domain-containing protein [Planktothrix sp.]
MRMEVRMRPVVLGALIGASLVYLLAPTSGRRVRARLKERLTQARDFWRARKEHLRAARYGVGEKPHRISEELDDLQTAAAG